MKLAATPNATHMPRRCSSMWSPPCETSMRGSPTKSAPEPTSEATTSAQVQRARTITAASAISTR